MRNLLAKVLCWLRGPPYCHLTFREKRACDATEHHDRRADGRRPGAGRPRRSPHGLRRGGPTGPARNAGDARGARSRAGRGAWRRRPLRRAGGGERGDERHGHRAGPHPVHAARRGVRAEGGEAETRRARRVHAATLRQRDHRALQHPGRAGRRRDHRPAGRRRERREALHDDADLAVLLALQPVPVHQRPRRRSPAARLVDHRVRLRARRDDPGAGHRQAVPAEPLLRRGAAPARQDVPRGRHGPAHRTGRQPGRVDRHRRTRLRTRTAAEDRPPGGQRPGVRGRSDRPPRLRGRPRQGHRLRQARPPEGLHPAGHLPRGPAHPRRRRHHQGRGPLVHEDQGPPGRPPRPRPRRFGPHGCRLLRQGRGGRRQPQRPPLRLRHRGRRTRAHRHRPGQRHRRGAQ